MFVSIYLIDVKLIYFVYWIKWDNTSNNIQTTLTLKKRAFGDPIENIIYVYPQVPLWRNLYMLSVDFKCQWLVSKMAAVALGACTLITCISWPAIDAFKQS